MNSKMYYCPSGKFTPIGILKALALSGIGVTLCAWIYSYVVAWVPIVYVIVLFVVGFATVSGGLVSAGLRGGNVRNTTVGIAVGVLIGALALYMSWVAWIFAQTNQEVFLVGPSELLKAIKMLGAEGVWSIKGTTPTGWGLYSFWIAEALAIVGGATYGGYQAVADTPFCEECGCWIDELETLGTFESPTDLRKVTSELECARTEGFEKLTPIVEFSGTHVVVVREVCEECKDFQLLTLKSRELTTDKDGKTDIKEKVLMNRLIVEPSFATALSQYWSEGLRKAQLTGATEQPGDGSPEG